MRCFVHCVSTTTMYICYFSFVRDYLF